MHIILSGKPGIGKTTILKDVISKFPFQKIVGCIVEEMRENNIRNGFKIKYIPSNKESVLASSEKKISDFYVSKYSVNIDEIENNLIPFMDEISQLKHCDLIVFDEIGRMQNVSPHFLGAVDRLMSVAFPLITTIVYENEEWAKKYKDSNKNFFIVVNEQNRLFIGQLIELILKNFNNFKQLSLSQQSYFLTLYNQYTQKNSLSDLINLFNHKIINC